MTGKRREGALQGAWMIWLAALLLALGALAPRAEADEGILEIVVGDQELLGLPGAMERTAIGRSDVASVVAIDERSLLITGQAPGMTTLRIWLEGRSRPQELRLRVLPDGSVGLEEEYLYSQDSARPRLSGDSESLERHAQARQRFGDGVIDATRQVGAVQVQADIRVVEVNRRKLQASGFFIGRTGSGSADFAVGSRSNALAFLGGSNVAPGSEGFSIIRANTSGVMSALTALNSNGFAYTLAEPSLVSLSGQTATFLAGGEFPFPSSSNRDGEVSIDYREFGVRLKLTPTVLDENRIMMKVAPEVSELDFSQGVQSGGVAVPALNVRRTDTTIQLGHGESFIISGLVSHNVIQSVDRIPGLGDIPVLGAFFRSTRLERDEKELVMIVTPHLVWPMAAGSEPELPGEALRGYRPSYLELLFDPLDVESIERTTNVGFSR
ncbi:type II and III secretion system protein family protein [Halomonas mongoliensis]|uniref:type II and III secretion system protein family protein n=1 Tax=Halomonas mongoliensis TaxID=321265 RepID=UPI00403A832C